MMQFLLLALTLASLAVAAPTDLERRQATQDEFSNGPCRDVILMFARGTTEGGNMGTLVGPPLARGLKAALGVQNVAAQGVDYAATVATNLLPNNADPRGVANMRNLMLQATQKCPDSMILASGYSQGAAIVHAAMEDLPAATLNQIAGVALFGDTRNLQERGRVAGYPQDQTLIICNPGDLVCSGTLTITAAHLTYGTRVPEATRFLVGMVQPAGAVGGN